VTAFGAAAMTPAVEVRDLVREFGPLRAVDGLSMTVAEGEIVGLLGPNGAGKTTTIRILTTLLRPTSGSASVCGFDVVRQPDEVRRSIGYVMQEIALDYLMTGREHLELQARMYHLPPKEVKSRVAEVLRMVELTEAADGKAYDYSGGMKKRLDIAAGMLHRPRVLILDEPSLGLDVQSRHNVWGYIEGMRRDGVTVLLATNYLDEADRLCDRLVIIDKGKVVVEGTPEGLKAAIGADVVSVQLEEGAEKLQSALGARPEVQETVASHDGLHVYVREAASFLPALVRLADELGLQPGEVTYKRPSLDDVFLLHTGHGLAEDRQG
jgi:ABC-2 type transport system ATP-binding protein